ncbi:MAG: ISNCY family transposase [Bryobacteraceae bacterium]
MMKLQDVILKAMAKKISWIDAAEIAGMSVRNMQRKRQAYEEYGYTGLFDQRRGKRSIQRVPMETAEKVLELFQTTYFDLSVRHFHEKLKAEHGIRLSYSWVKQALQGAGLVKKRRKRGAHRRRRERKRLPGMLLHIDGSKHRWFQDDRYYDFIVVLDDATSEIYYAQLVEEESTRTVMAALREVIQTQGVFCSLYSDRGSHFFLTPKAGETVDKTRLTQVGRAMRELNIEMIPAYSPQARGRSERNFGTWQNRLPQELRLAGISTIEDANRFLRQSYIEEFNRMFAKAAREKGTAFRKCDRKDLDEVFSIQTERTVAKDNTIAIRDRHWQLDRTPFRRTLADCRVTICEHLDKTVSVRWGPHIVGRFDSEGRPLQDTPGKRRSGASKVKKTACGSKEVDRPFPVSPPGKAVAGGFPPRREHAARQPKPLARADAVGSPHKRATAPL